VRAEAERGKHDPLVDQPYLALDALHGRVRHGFPFRFRKFLWLHMVTDTLIPDVDRQGLSWHWKKTREGK